MWEGGVKDEEYLDLNHLQKSTVYWQDQESQVVVDVALLQ